MPVTAFATFRARAVPALLLLACVAVLQWHGLQWWSQHLGPSGYAVAAALDLGALWCWSRRRAWAVALAVPCTLLVIAGPLGHVAEPVWQDWRAGQAGAAAHADTLASLRADIADTAASLRRYERNSAERLGWAGRIDATRERLDALRERERAMLAAAPPPAPVAWQSLALTAAYLLALVLLELLKIAAMCHLARPLRAPSRRDAALPPAAASPTAARQASRPGVSHPVSRAVAQVVEGSVEGVVAAQPPNRQPVVAPGAQPVAGQTSNRRESPENQPQPPQPVAPNRAVEAPPPPARPPRPPQPPPPPGPGEPPADLPPAAHVDDLTVRRLQQVMHEHIQAAGGINALCKRDELPKSDLYGLRDRLKPPDQRKYTISDGRLHELVRRYLPLDPARSQA